MIRDLDVPGTVIHMYATASGTVIERKVNEGEMVTSSINAFGEGTVVMQIADLSKMVVTSNINEVDIIKFKVGQEAIIKLDALPYEEFSGKIISISPKAVVINSAKVFPVEISINATGDRVKPGMTAAISILGDSRKDVLIIRLSVFADDKNQDIVYLIQKRKNKMILRLLYQNQCPRLSTGSKRLPNGGSNIRALRRRQDIANRAGER